MNRNNLLDHHSYQGPEASKAAQLARDIKGKEEAEDEIDNAKDILELNRAQAKLNSAQWSLERVCSRIYDRSKKSSIRRRSASPSISAPGSDGETVINAEPQTQTSNVASKPD